MNAPTVAVGRWELDPATSTARFVARGMGRSVPGSIPFLSARCDVDAGGVPRRATADLDLAAIDTGNVRRDRDLAKPGLLDIAAHPTMTVEVDDLSVTSDGWTAIAVVHARGTAAPVEVTVVPETAPSADDAAVRIRGRLDRRLLGIKAPRFAIGRWVDLDVTARFRHR